MLIPAGKLEIPAHSKTLTPKCPCQCTSKSPPKNVGFQPDPAKSAESWSTPKKTYSLQFSHTTHTLLNSVWSCVPGKADGPHSVTQREWNSCSRRCRVYHSYGYITQVALHKNMPTAAVITVNPRVDLGRPRADPSWKGGGTCS